MIDAGVIQIEEGGKSKCALIFGQMNESAGVRMRVTLTSLTQAEYFRDVNGQDVLLFVDNIFRFTQVKSFSGPKKLFKMFFVVHLGWCRGFFFTWSYSFSCRLSEYSRIGNWYSPR